MICMRKLCFGITCGCHFGAHMARYKFYLLFFTFCCCTIWLWLYLGQTRFFANFSLWTFLGQISVLYRKLASCVSIIFDVELWVLNIHIAIRPLGVLLSSSNLICKSRDRDGPHLLS